MTNTDATTSTHTIYSYLLPTLEERINRANRRAARIGALSYTLVSEETEPEAIYDDDLTHRWHRDINGQPDYPMDRSGRRVEPYDFRQRHIVTISGIVPQLPGAWEFIGMVTEDPIAGPMPKLLGDEAQRLNVNLDEYRDPETWNTCDHCHTNRDRAKVFLLRDQETGQITRVGSTCMSTFLGITFQVPDGAFSLIREIEDMDDLGWSGDPLDVSHRIDHVLAIAWATMSEYGWMSSNTASYIPGAVSTGQRVSLLMKAKGWDAAEERYQMIDSVPATLVNQLVAYARNLGDTDNSEYARTVSAIVRGQHENNQLVSGANVKILASVVSGFQRAQDRKAQNEAIANSEYVGEIKKRQTFTGLRVLSTRTFEGEYGSRQLVKFVSPEGNLLVWWNTGSANPSVDATYDVTGTPKAHEEYQGVKQTILTRCKLSVE